MKQLAEKIFSNIKSVQSSQLISIINSNDCKYVSFDVFDTLIKRNINQPDDLFLILENEFNTNFHKKLPIYNIRKKAERDANLNTNQEDVSIDMIYDAMQGLTYSQKEWLQDKEIKLEKSLCQVNPLMAKVYEWCKKKGKIIFIISDMYLPKKVIADILKSAGYSDWKNLYVSNEYGKRKSTGKLFDFILKKEKIDKKAIIHIGDAPKGDYVSPSKHGIKAKLIKTHETHTLFFNKRFLEQERKRKHFTYNIVNSFVNNNIDNEYGFFEKIGYEVIGPILYGYCMWLKSRANKENIQKLFFLTREGAFLKKAFNILNPSSSTTELIRVSRRATSLPLLDHAENFDELLNLMTVTRSDFTLYNLIDSLNLSKKDSENLKIELGNVKVKNLQSVEKKKLFKKIKPYIKKMSYRQNANIHGYLKSKNFQGRIGVCDVGWHGTIQSNLERIFPGNYIEGFYIGKKDKKDEEHLNASSYLFDNLKNKKINNEIMSAPDLFELFFLSTDGTALSYEVDEKGNYLCRQAQPEQTINNAKKIFKLQRAALKFLTDFKSLNSKLNLSLDPYSAEAAYSELINPPSSRLIKELKEFSFLNVGTHTLLAAHDFPFYIFNPSSFVAEFLNSGSKSLFLKSIFKFPFPYIKLIVFLRKFDNE